MAFSYLSLKYDRRLMAIQKSFEMMYSRRTLKIDIIQTYSKLY